jgi:hypothetical protein
MNKEMSMTDLTMPAGRYYVGDLCYVLQDEWTEVCGLLFANRDDGGCNEGVFTLTNGCRFAIFSTAYGDGIYTDQDNREYPVDAGSIGCVLLDDIAQDNVNNNISLGNTIQFDQEFLVDSDGAVLKFGHIAIDTDPQWDEDDDGSY